MLTGNYVKWNTLSRFNDSVSLSKRTIQRLHSVHSHAVISTCVACHSQIVNTPGATHVLTATR